jgi:hypothetical protein
VDASDLDNRFQYHAPGEDRRIQHSGIRDACRLLAGTLNSLPEGREKLLAMTKLEEVMFWSNAAIARQP